VFSKAIVVLQIEVLVEYWTSQPEYAPFAAFIFGSPRLPLNCFRQIRRDTSHLC
jgi:hypothetical protein